MYTLFISNKGRTVFIDLADIHIRYCGPKSLIKFLKINKYEDDVVYVETEFSYGIEEDYIDIYDLFQEYNYEKYISLISDVKIKEKNLTMKNKKEKLIDESLMVSDNFALIANINTADDIIIETVNLSNTNKKANIRLKDLTVLQTNMTDSSLKRAVEAIKRNMILIQQELIERMPNAKIY